jgi:hypothetical protein
MSETEKIKEWTIMFFFAGDNALSPLIVSQLKAIKDAGFHEDVDVLAHFDSNEVGVPTRIFHVNRRRMQKLKDSLKRRHKPGLSFMVGDNGDPFVRDMIDDNIDPKELEESSPGLSQSLRHEDSATSLEALQNFINFCAREHKAKNYILFLVGHGLVVGHDAFLPDDRPLSALRLADMRDALEEFNKRIEDYGTLQLLALHSCAMSAVEVAYELKGLAKYMMGSEGISYIGSWPYRQLLMKIISTVARANGNPEVPLYGENGASPPAPGARLNSEAAVEQLIEKLYFLSLYNATDYAISGYSLDLTLCSLDPKNFRTLKGAVKTLVRAMRSALKDKTPKGRVIKQLILLAHWESQSYWDESYTDMSDFCRCLHKRCSTLLEMMITYADGKQSGEIHDELKALAAACEGVMGQLRERPGDLSKRFKGLVIHSRHSGPQYQYSHGLSVYFPWSRPIDDDLLPRLPAPLPSTPAGQNGEQKSPQSIEGEETAKEVMDRYHDYLFNKDMKGASWADFLDTYFKMTMRKTRRAEDAQMGVNGGSPGRGANIFGGGMVGSMVASLASDKPTPSTGRPCTCTTIKNYPTELRSDPVSGKPRYVKVF